MHHKKLGFTIVELLIVIVIIAILAAMTFVAYNGIQARARDGEVKSGIVQAKKKLLLYQVDNGVYPATGNQSAAGISNGNVVYQYTQTGTGAGFCLTGTSAGIAINTTESSGLSNGACAGHSTNGVVAVDNIFTNPSFETDTSTWAFQNSSGAGTFSRVTGGAGIVSGSAAAEIYAPNTPTTLRQSIVGLPGSTPHTFSIYFTQISGPAVSITMSVSDTGGAGNNSISFTPAVGVTSRQSVTWTTSPTPGTALVRVMELSGSANFTYRVDAMMLEQSATASTYID